MMLRSNQSASEVELTVVSGTTGRQTKVTADAVIGADGIHSVVRR